MASDALFQELAKALGRPSKTFRAAQAGLEIPGEAIKGYQEGATLADQIEQRNLERQTLAEALGSNAPEGTGGMTVRQANNLVKPVEAYAALLRAKREGTGIHSQLVGFDSKTNKGLVYTPNGGLSLIDNPIDGPILPRTVTPTMTPYATPSGQPVEFTPGKGLSPTKNASGSGGTPVLKQGNESAINDVSLIRSQAPLVDVLFDAYKSRGPYEAKAQATPLGYLLDPAAKQAENALKLSAFTFGGKTLTGNEKQVVFNALFPSAFDNEVSRENKRALLKDYYAGKVDLLQAANLLGPAGGPLKAMLQSKANVQGGVAEGSTGDPEADAAIQAIRSANISQAEKDARIAGVRAASQRK